jgi:hypothetical protein
MAPLGSASRTRSSAAIRPSLEKALITSTSPLASARYMKVGW